MTRDEAQKILQAYRPNGADADDAFFSEALRLAETDPELGEWFAAEQEFDRGMTQAYAGVAAPAELRSRLLAQAAGVQPWWNRPLRTRQLALAASFALAAAIAVFWLISPRAELRRARAAN